jgi:hypothetical protein
MKIIKNIKTHKTIFYKFLKGEVMNWAMNGSELEFCMVCGNPNPPDRAICTCGGRDFVFGNNFTYENKKVVCNCGNDEFEKYFHMNTNPYYTTNYRCAKCRNLIATQTYYKSPYLDDCDEENSEEGNE